MAEAMHAVSNVMPRFNGTSRSKKYSLLFLRFPRRPGRHIHVVPVLLAPAEYVRDGEIPGGGRGSHLPLRQLPSRLHCQEDDKVEREE
jgi:hypothetical protein